MFALVAILALVSNAPVFTVDLSQLAPEASSAIALQQSKAASNADHWQLLGKLYHAHGLEEEAIESYAYSTSLARSPNTSYLHGVALAHVGRYEEAIAEVADIDNYVPAIWQQGFWQLDLGNNEIAKSKFDAAMQADKNCVPAFVGLARVHLASGAPELAIVQLDALIARGGIHPYVNFLLGTAHRRAGNHATATRLLATPVNGPPSWKDPWMDEMYSHTKGYAADVAKAMQSIDAGNLTKALGQLTALKKRYPKDPTVLNNLATVYLKLGQLDQAQEVLQKSMRWSPAYAPTQLTMAFTMRAKGNTELAIAYAKKAITLQPAMSPAHALVGRLSFQNGDLPNAATYFAQAIKLGNSDPSIREMHGMVLLNLGKVRDALKQFELVLQVSPDRPISISGAAIAIALLGNPDEALKQLAIAKATFQNEPNIERAWQSVLKIKGRE